MSAPGIADQKKTGDERKLPKIHRMRKPVRAGSDKLPYEKSSRSAKNNRPKELISSESFAPWCARSRKEELCGAKTVSLINNDSGMR